MSAVWWKAAIGSSVFALLLSLTTGLYLHAGVFALACIVLAVTRTDKER